MPSDFFRNADNQDKFTAYKLLICDVVDNELRQ
jgi:hypothetical protein